MRNENNYFNEGDFITDLKLRTDTYPTKVTLARAGNTGGDVACRRCKAAPVNGIYFSILALFALCREWSLFS
jgi:hypothetical protein